MENLINNLVELFTQDVIDVSDLKTAVEQIDERMGEVMDLLSEVEEGDDDWEELNDEYVICSYCEEFINEVKEMLDNCSGDYLISESHIYEYIREQLEDAYSDVLSSIPHFIEIDWDESVDNCKQDYSEWNIENSGETYVYYSN